MTDTQEDADLLIDYGHGNASIEINPSHTLADVRKLMLEEFDNDMFPQEDPENWGFWVNDMRVALKQEARKVAWKYLNCKSLSIRSTNSAKRNSPPTVALAAHVAKRAKTAGPGGTKDNVDIADGAPSGEILAENDDSKLTKGGWLKRKPNEPVWAAEASQDITDVGVDILDISDDEDEEDEYLASLLVENPMVQPDLAFEKTKANLRIVDAILNDTERNQRAFSEARRNECSREVKQMLKAKRPQTIIGVYGSTGVGKSSLLNAMLEEASVLPTSGSQGCTAAVVELTYNSDLVLCNDGADGGPSQHKQRVAVYRGEVEFMTKTDWEGELRILVEECSTDKGSLYSSKPYEKSQPAAAAAWSKINQVYGGGTLERCYDMKGKAATPDEENESDSDSEVETLADADAPAEVKETWTTERVFQYLRNDQRVSELLTPEIPDASCNVIKLHEGLVEAGSDDARALVKPFAETSESERMIKEHWASAFREKIDAYVYKNGKESDAQTWPLIRKVRLLGPWHVLSTGACLVDLPGVKDANAARARVAETYLEHCSNIWIVAPIKRAVDDGTAKDLMGDQFKRRLLMDGQYGNISFICTSTDKVEVSETMRDHSDIAKQTAGRWEKMTELVSEAKRLGNKERERGALEQALQAASRSFKITRKAFMASNSLEERERLTVALEQAKMKRQGAAAKLEEFRADVGVAERQSKKMQDHLKVLCAKVRNDYSKGRLQDDFRNGLREMYLKDCAGRLPADVPGEQLALPASFKMDVFCTSANDYMKATGIKSYCDGPPETFFDPVDTQIPMLRSYVHDTTNNHCEHFVRTFVESAEHLLRKVELFASGAKYAASNEEIALVLKASFDTELSKIETKVLEISTNFEREMDSVIIANLKPALSGGADKSKEAAMTTIKSWGSVKKRTKTERNQERNGLVWSTYQATIRRNGEYTSKSVGLVDMNQELYDPMEKAFATDWQRIMGATTKRLLSGAKEEVQRISDALVEEVCSSFTKAGFEKSSLDALMTAATRASSTALDVTFQRMDKASTRLQRKLTRSMLPKIKKRMRSSYRAAASVECGAGKFERMKGAIHNTSGHVISSMFSETLSHMDKEISKAIKAIAKSILETSTLMRAKLESFLSLSWDIERAKASSVSNDLLPEIARLLGSQKEASKLLRVDGEAANRGTQHHESPATSHEHLSPLEVDKDGAAAKMGVVDLSTHE